MVVFDATATQPIVASLQQQNNSRDRNQSRKNQKRILQPAGGARKYDGTEDYAGKQQNIW